MLDFAPLATRVAVSLAPKASGSSENLAMTLQ
jgi:hypothetical protein